MFDPFGVHIHSLGEDATKSLHFAPQIIELGVDAQSVLAKVYGGHGPFRTAKTSVNWAASRSSSAFRSGARSVGTRTARDTATLSLVHVSCQTSWRSIASSVMRLSTIDAARARRASRPPTSPRRPSMYRRPGPAGVDGIVRSSGASRQRS